MIRRESLSKRTRPEQRILVRGAFIWLRCRCNNKKLRNSGVSPSYEEMKQSLNLKSKSGIHRLISALEERGF
ncbi:MAG: hypothetical protein ACPGQI_03935, partial [Gammaproteobacteria bacterium]